MTIVQSIILGIVQGLTEFLPVSSSGHLVLLTNFYEISQGNLLYSVLLHLGSLAAVLIYFRKDIILLVIAFLSGLKKILTNKNDSFSGDEKKVGYIIIATIPTVFIGVLLNDFFNRLYSNDKYVAFSLILTGFLLLLTLKVKNNNKSASELTICKSIIIGLFQGLAIIPGISRSGSTIAGGIFSGLRNDEAAKFSFIMSIPAILGASVYEIINADFVSINFDNNIFFGILMSFISGMIGIKFLMKILNKNNIHYFSIYVFILAIFILMI